MKSIGYFERSSTFFALRVETYVGYIDEAASISHGMVMRMIDAVDIPITIVQPTNVGHITTKGCKQRSNVIHDCFNSFAHWVVKVREKAVW